MLYCHVFHQTHHIEFVESQDTERTESVQGFKGGTPLARDYTNRGTRFVYIDSVPMEIQK